MAVRRRWRALGAAIAGAGLLAVAAPAALAGGACSVTNTGSGASFGALGDALAEAAAGDSLAVSGTCASNATVSRDVTLQGASSSATLDGGGTGRVLTITNGATVTLRDLVVRGGRTNSAGGGILASGGTAVTLIDVEVKNNSAGQSSFGGGIEAGPAARLALVRSSVKDNVAGSSGGIDSDGAIVSLNASKVTGNRATHAPSSDGDGCGFGTPTTIYACAGGIWNFLGTLVLVDSKVIDNAAGYRGGGLRSDASVNAAGSVTGGATILGGTTTIEKNTAGDQGGGIWARVRQAGVPVDPSIAFLASDGSLTDPLTGAAIPTWTGSVTGNKPDQCFGLGFPSFALGTHSCGATFG